MGIQPLLHLVQPKAQDVFALFRDRVNLPGAGIDPNQVCRFQHLDLPVLHTGKDAGRIA